MTKKDYIAIAKAIRENDMDSGLLLTEPFIDALCKIFKDDNPRFDIARFRRASSKEE